MVGTASPALRVAMVGTLLVVGPLLASLAHAINVAEFLITGRSIGRISLGATKETIKQSHPDYQVVEVGVSLEGDATSPALQVRRGEEILITAEITEAEGAWRITTAHPRFKTSGGVGVGSTYAALVRAHGQPAGAELPEGALFVHYRIGGGEVGFQLDRGFDAVAFKRASPPADAIIVRIVVM